MEFNLVLMIPGGITINPTSVFLQCLWRKHTSGKSFSLYYSCLLLFYNIQWLPTKTISRIITLTEDGWSHIRTTRGRGGHTFKGSQRSDWEGQFLLITDFLWCTISEINSRRQLQIVPNVSVWIQCGGDLLVSYNQGLQLTGLIRARGE